MRYSDGDNVKSIADWTGSQKLTAIVTLLYAGTTLYHYRGGRYGTAVLTGSWVIGNAAMVYMEGV